MNILTFDTETTGLPEKVYKNGKVITKMPYMLQISWILFNVEKNKVISSHDHIITLPDNISIPESSIKFHNITHEIMEKSGEPITYVLRDFIRDLKDTDYIVGHNVSFDINMVKEEFSRNGFINYFDVLSSKTITYCTMKEGEELCNILISDVVSGKQRLKYPKLEELHHFLFKQPLMNLHNSYNDVLVCFRCFYKMIYDRDILRMNKMIRSQFKSVFDISVTPYGVSKEA
jgi:DNA polymerase III epsilon subunit-like protein